MKNITTHISSIKKNGFTVIENVLSVKDCDFFIKRSNLLLKKLLDKKITTTLNKNCQFISCPFRYDKKFFKLIHFEKVDKILSKILDQDYILVHHFLANRRIYKNKLLNGKNIGEKWHTDSRYLGGKKLIGLSYIGTLMLDDFTEKNASTFYIPKSHLSSNKPIKDGKYKHKTLIGKKGSMVLFDSGLWHRGGNPTAESRWSLGFYYGPWWMKPYFRFTDMLGLKNMKKLNKRVKKLLHYYSNPPKNIDERISTVVRDY